MKMSIAYSNEFRAIRFCGTSCMIPFSRLFRKFVSAYYFVREYSEHLPLAGKAIFNLSCTITTIRGSIRGCGKPIVLLYVGRRWNYDFLLDLMLEDYEIVSEESVTLFTARSRSRPLMADADIEIVDVCWPYVARFNRDGAYLEFTDWLNMALPLKQDWESTVRSFRKTTRNNDLRLIRRNQYRFEVTNDPEIIGAFYDNMYVPSAGRRHGTASIIAPKKHVLKRAQQGKLLQVYRGDELVIAGVIYPEADVLYFLWQGSPPLFQERPPEGAASALYYFGIQYAFDNGISTVDFAGTRAFLDFGDFRFKRKWGARVDDAFSPNSVLMRPLNNDENTITFCERFPVIACCDEGLEAVIVRQDDTADSDALRRLDKHYNCDGLARTVLILVSDGTPASATTTELNGHEFHVIQCHPDQFASRYVERSLTSN